jgi:hypothetical protein
MSLSRARTLDKEGEVEPPEEEEEEFLSLWGALSWLCLIADPTLPLSGAFPL